jgi:hypothetical protein
MLLILLEKCGVIDVGPIYNRPWQTKVRPTETEPMQHVTSLESPSVTGCYLRFAAPNVNFLHYASHYRSPVIL